MIDFNIKNAYTPVIYMCSKRRGMINFDAKNADTPVFFVMPKRGVRIDFMCPLCVHKSQFLPTRRARDARDATNFGTDQTPFLTPKKGSFARKLSSF